MVRRSAGATAVEALLDVMLYLPASEMSEKRGTRARALEMGGGAGKAEGVADRRPVDMVLWE